MLRYTYAMSPELVRALQHLAHCDPDLAVARAIAGPLPDRTRTAPAPAAWPP